MNTLADFRISKTYRGQNGEGGSGNDCTGHGGDDIQVPVPVGTVVTDVETGETLGDLTTSGQTLLVAKGGKGGGGTRGSSRAPTGHPARRVSVCPGRSANSPWN